VLNKLTVAKLLTLIVHCLTNSAVLAAWNIRSKY